MIIGIGTDIVQISRLDKAMEKIKQHCFTASELAYAGKSTNAVQHLAGRWAAKEAFAKALGCGFGSKCSWGDLEIANDEYGKPQMRITGSAAVTFRESGGKYVHLSISHENEYATAFVIIEGEK